MKLFRYFFLVILFVSISFGNGLHAQYRKVLNLPKYDMKLYHFGFILGINQMFFTVKRIPDFKELDSLLILEGKPDMGFNIGIVSNLRLGNYWDLRFIPTLSFGERNLIYTLKQGDTLLYESKKKVESWYIDFPLMVKFKSKRLNNTRAYVLSGVKYSIDLASQAKQKEDDEEIIIKLLKSDIAFEFGVGFDFYFTEFKMGTEIKMAYGILDLLKREDNIYTDPIDKLTSKIFQFSLTFE